MMCVKPRKLSSPSSIIGQAGLMGASHHRLMLSTYPQMDAKSTKGGQIQSMIQVFGGFILTCMGRL